QQAGDVGANERAKASAIESANENDGAPGKPISREQKAAKSVDARRFARGLEQASALRARQTPASRGDDEPVDAVAEHARRINEMLRRDLRAGAKDLDDTMKDL